MAKSEAAVLRGVAGVKGGKTTKASAAAKANTEPTEAEMAAFIAALSEAEEAARRVLRQAELNTSHLRAARLEIQTARDIVVASNQLAADREAAGVAQ